MRDSTVSEQLRIKRLQPDYNGVMEPLSRDFLLARGYCCKLGCRNCPYDEASNATPANRICARSSTRNQANEEDVKES